MNGNTIISLKNVSLNFTGPESGKPVIILNNVNFDVKQGEAVSIVGPSGSGKTSLMMIIAGIERASSGNINIIKKDITEYTEDELAKFRAQHISIVFQNFHLIPTMSAFENVKIALEFSDKKHGDINHLAEEALKEVGLSHRLHHMPSQLSGGEQQRVALARAIVTRPDILLADEPTGNLDSANGANIIDLLLKLKEKYGTTLLLITHDKELAAKTSRTVTMQDGILHG